MKKRYFQPYTEIKAEPLNELQDYTHDDMKSLIKNVLGASSGVVNGLDCSIYSTTGRTISYTSGTVTDSNGAFYEALTSGIVGLPYSTGNYYIYASNDVNTLNDELGYILLNTTIKQESYGYINTTIYDSLNISSTQDYNDILNNQYIPLASGTITGSVIQTITDIKVPITIGNIISNSLQAFYDYSRNTALKEGYITGIILSNNTPTEWEKVIIDNGNSSIGYNVNTGNNSNSIAYNSLINGNKAVNITINGNNSNGIYVTNDNSNSNGFYYTSSGNLGVGININQASTGIVLSNCIKGIKLVNCTTGIIVSSGTTGIEITQTTGSGIRISNMTTGITFNNCTYVLQSEAPFALTGITPKVGVIAYDNGSLNGTPYDSTPTGNAPSVAYYNVPYIGVKKSGVTGLVYQWARLNTTPIT